MAALKMKLASWDTKFITGEVVGFDGDTARFTGEGGEVKHKKNLHLIKVRTASGSFTEWGKCQEYVQTTQLEQLQTLAGNSLRAKSSVCVMCLKYKIIIYHTHYSTHYKRMSYIIIPKQNLSSREGINSRRRFDHTCARNNWINNAAKNIQKCCQRYMIH